MYANNNPAKAPNEWYIITVDTENFCANFPIKGRAAISSGIDVKNIMICKMLKTRKLPAAIIINSSEGEKYLTKFMCKPGIKEMKIPTKNAISQFCI